MAQELILPEGQRLEIPDVLRRVAPAFRYVCIDWMGCDKSIDGAVKKLRELHAPELVIEAKLKEKGKRVQVLVADDGEGNPEVLFRMGPKQPILASDPSHKYE